MVKKLLVLTILFIAVSMGWYLFYPREQASGLKALPSRTDADSFSRKISDLAAPKKNSSARQVEFRESEVEAYIQHDLAPLFPKGLKQVDVQLLQDSVSANSKINFDEIETSGEGQKSSLLSALFRGEHTVDVVATVKTQNGIGSYEIAKVSLDQREIPKPLVDMLVAKYIVPKYPPAKPNTPFPLPYNIERIDLQQGKAVVHQSAK